MLSKAAAVLTLGLALMATASAEDFGKLGFSADDLREYRDKSAVSFPSCQEAMPQVKSMMNDLNHVTPSVHLAGLLGQCHMALQHSGARVQLLRANDMFLGMQCIAIGLMNNMNGDVPPACNIESAIPAP